MKNISFKAAKLGDTFIGDSYEHQVVSVVGLQSGTHSWPWCVVKLSKLNDTFEFELRQSDAMGGVLKSWPKDTPADEWGPYLRLNLSETLESQKTYNALREKMSDTDRPRLSAMLRVLHKAVAEASTAEHAKLPWWDKAADRVREVFLKMGVFGPPKTATAGLKPVTSKPAVSATKSLAVKPVVPAAPKASHNGIPKPGEDTVIQGVQNGRLRGWLRASTSVKENQTVGCWDGATLVAVGQAVATLQGKGAKTTELRFDIALPPEVRDGQNHSFKVAPLDAEAPNAGPVFDLNCPVSLTSDVINPAKAPAPTWNQKDFGIIVMGHTRTKGILAILESLKRQGVLHLTHVWLDGDQGKPGLKKQVEELTKEIQAYPVARIHSHRGHFGFRKSILQALSFMVDEFRSFVLLEDDCFPTSHMAEVFWKQLQMIEHDDSVFSVYGSPFLMPSEGEYCDRFQGWGWGTTSAKMRPFLRQLIECYSMPEPEYKKFVGRVFTKEIQKRIDITPPRLPSYTLPRFFAWDETLTLLTALQGMKHMPTNPRTIYNFGVGGDSDHFKNIDWYRKPPFNMVTYDELWQHF